MRPSAFSLLALLGLAATPAFAQSGDPSDQFLNAYLAFQKAEKAEAGGNFRGAITGYSQTVSILDQVRARWPSWNPAIVTHRREKATEGIDRLQAKVSPEPSSPSGVVEPPLPSGSEAILPPDSFPAAPSSSNSRNTSRRTSGDPLKEIQDRIEGLQKDLSATRDRLEKATQEKDELSKKYDKALKDAKESTTRMETLQKRADRAEAALTEAEKSGNKQDSEVDALKKEAADAKRALRQLQIERDAEAELNEQFADIISSARARAKQLTDERNSAKKESAEVPKRIADMQKEIDKVLREKGDLETKLNKVQEQLSKVSGERDEAVAQLNRMREAAKNVDKLLADNTALMAKVQDAEKQIATFKAEGAEKDRKIADLSKELTTTKQQLADAQKQSAEAQTQLNDLRKQLETQSKELTQVKADAAQSVADRKRLMEENDLLRGIVLRQQKEQAVRDRTKKLVLEQLAKLEISSKAINEQIELLGSPIVKLTEREKRLFKEPQLTINENEITFAAPDAVAGPAVGASDPNKAAAAPAPSSPAEPAKPSVPEVQKTAEKTVETKTDAVPEPALKLDQGVPESDQLPGLGQGKPTELAKADGAGKLPPVETKKSTPMDGDLPTKEPGESAAASHSASKGGVAPAVPPELVGLARDAKDQFERGNYRESEKIYLKAKDKAPNNLYVLSNLGVTQFRQQKFKLAEETFKKAIAIAPEDDFSHCTLGIVYYQQGKFDDAIQALTRALAINSKNPTAHNYLGITASQKGWQEAAQKELETALALDPNYADAHFNLAVVFATQQPPNKEDARKHYKRATELGAEPDSALEQIIK